MTKYFTLLIIIFSTCLNAQNHYFEKISPESGFAFDAINTICEDCNGMVWFGSNSGLYFYNTATINKVSLEKDTLTNVGTHSEQIKKIYKDNYSDIWICTEKGLYKRNKLDGTFSKINFLNRHDKLIPLPRTDNIIQYNDHTYYIIADGKLYYFDKQNLVLNKVSLNHSEETLVSCLAISHNGEVIVGTHRGEVYIGKSPYSNFELLYHKINTSIRSIFQDNNKYYIGYNDKGVSVVNINGDKLYEFNYNLKGIYHLPDNHIRDIIKANNGDVWIATFKGILVVNQEGSTVISSKQNTGLPFNSIYDLHNGINGGIWVGTWTGGIAYYRDINYKFHHIKKVPNESTETKSIISSFIEDNNGDIWIGSEQSGINHYSTQKNKFIPLKFPFSDKLPEGIKTFTSENSKDIYVGTLYGGIWKYSHSNKKLQKLTIASPLDSTVISSLTIKDNELWVASRATKVGLSRYNLVNHHYKSYSLPTDLNKGVDLLRIWKLLFDTQGNLWLAAEDGLYYIAKENEQVVKCFNDDKKYNLNNTLVYTLYADANNNIWFGTKGKGIFKYSSQSQELFQIGEDASLYNCDVYGITQDINKNIWFSTNQGIYNHDINKNKTTHYSIYDGIPGNQFIPNSAYATKKGEIFFGSSNGFCFINPAEIKTNTIAPNIYLSKLLINNKPIHEETGFISNSLVTADIKNITLKHYQNSLTFGVVANNFIKPLKNKFRYRLLNYSNNWIEISQNKEITFTKIPPGKYSLEVIGSNNDDIWNQVPLNIQIRILPPLWSRWYAILIYLIITLTLAVIVWRELNLKMNLRKQILTERYKSEVNEEIFEEKLRFFTNISHEIRTPLTLIISPLNSLIKKFQYDEKTAHHLLIMKRNSSRLLRLTNQILDFRLHEVGKLKAKFKKTDIVAICSEVFNYFEFQVKEKNINFIFNTSFNSMWISIDGDMVEKIIYNLIANAIKFSEEKGQIFLSIEKKALSEESYKNYMCKGNRFTGESIEIKVQDFGKGIKDEVLGSILDRFTISPDEHNTGTGIGLHLCQEYAKLNNGNILVSSKEGEGATFILNIPFKKNSKYEEKNMISQFIQNDTDFDGVEPNPVFDKDRPVVLLAEDNDDLRSYLKEFLSNYFNVLTAKNGQQAYEISNEVSPNLLITDILMPILDGMELTQKIKNSTKTQHIPIIVLTALSENKYQKESIIKGVDSFLTKPIDESLLLAQIENILRKSEAYSDKGKEKTVDSNQKSDTISLVDKIESLVEKNLRNSDFSLGDVIEELNVSRSTLHRKIKAATNQSPTEFIRDIRLNNAVKLMKSNNFNIDEIGTYVGFNSTSYFIRSFKKKYGKTPKEYYLSLK